jgi:phage-related tail protein
MNTRKDLSEKLEPVSEAVAKAAVTVGETAKAAAKMAEPTVKAAEKSLRKAAKMAEPTVKSAQKKLKDAAKMAEPTVKAAGETIRATGKLAAAALASDVYVQWGNREVLCSDVLERAKQDYKAAHKTAILSCRLYIKPEEGVAYYVINDAEGKIEL